MFFAILAIFVTFCLPGGTQMLFLSFFAFQEAGYFCHFCLQGEVWEQGWEQCLEQCWEQWLGAVVTCGDEPLFLGLVSD